MGGHSVDGTTDSQKCHNAVMCDDRMKSCFEPPLTVFSERRCCLTQQKADFSTLCARRTQKNFRCWGCTLFFASKSDDFFSHRPQYRGYPLKLTTRTSSVKNSLKFDLSLSRRRGALTSYLSKLNRRFFSVLAGPEGAPPGYAYALSWRSIFVVLLVAGCIHAVDADKLR